MSHLFEISDHPDRSLALASYRQLAVKYDATCNLIDPVRKKAISLLGLLPGQVALDVASGTGLSLPMLSQAVGPGGTVLALEQSPEMAAISLERTRRLGLCNVCHAVAPVEETSIECVADAALFCYTHDVLRNPKALQTVFAALRPGATVVIAGYKSATGWKAIFNPWFRHRACGYLSTFEGMGAPWSHLFAYVPNFEIVEEYFLGSGYLGIGSIASLPVGEGAGQSEEPAP